MQTIYVFLGVALLTVCKALSQEERIVGWNKANGLWGKRSLSDDIGEEQVFGSQQKRPVQNFNKLNGLWGKRSDPYYDAFPELQKRAAQWQMANGLWGR